MGNHDETDVLRTETLKFLLNFQTFNFFLIVQFLDNVQITVN